MKVEGSGSVRTGTLRRAERGSSGDGTAFARELARASDTGASSGASPVTSLAALLAAQSTDDPAERRRRARQRAHLLLDRLDEVRTALLTGVLPAGTITALRSILAVARDGVDDPALTGILDEIDLRAQVELAKLGIFD